MRLKANHYRINLVKVINPLLLINNQTLWIKTFTLYNILWGYNNQYKFWIELVFGHGIKSQRDFITYSPLIQHGLLSARYD